MAQVVGVPGHCALQRWTLNRSGSDQLPEMSCRRVMRYRILGGDSRLRRVLLPRWTDRARYFHLHL